MRVFRIAVTGGPCALKTKSIKAIEEHIKQKYSYPVFLLEETATDLIKNVMHPNDYGDDRNFQPVVFRFQTAKEEALLKKINNECDEDHCVMICDRGILDNKAYLPTQKDFDMILEKYGYNEINILDSYDLVLDLISTANSIYGDYGTDNNKERYEKGEFARFLDAKTTNAWIGHRNLEIIDCKPTPEEKIEDILQKIDNFLDKKEAKKQNKYMIDICNSDFSIYNDDNSKVIDIEEYDLLNPFDGKYTFTKRTYKGSSSYLIRYTEEHDGKEKVLCDTATSERIFNNLVKAESSKLISIKRRLVFAKDKKIYNIDFYNENEAYLVIDGDIKDYDLPSNIKLSVSKFVEKSDKILKKAL